MFDKTLRPLIDPPLNRWGRLLAQRGITADQVTLAGLGLTVLCAGLIALGLAQWALVPLLLARVADGLDGAVARATRLTDLGGLHDVVADYAFYGLIPLGFVLADPGGNGVAGAILLVSFYVNGGSFLALAALAAKRGLSTRAQGVKAIYYSGGLLEGGETIAFFVLLCLWPGAFVPLALIFAALCFLSAALRLRAARTILRD
jgi:phosphatidylglycerophosphate synthase